MYFKCFHRYKKFSIPALQAGLMVCGIQFLLICQLSNLHLGKGLSVFAPFLFVRRTSNIPLEWDMTICSAKNCGVRRTSPTMEWVKTMNMLKMKPCWFSRLGNVLKYRMGFGFHSKDLASDRDRIYKIKDRNHAAINTMFRCEFLYADKKRKRGCFPQT